MKPTKQHLNGMKAVLNKLYWKAPLWLAGFLVDESCDIYKGVTFYFDEEKQIVRYKTNKVKL